MGERINFKNGILIAFISVIYIIFVFSCSSKKVEDIKNKKVSVTVSKLEKKTVIENLSAAGTVKAISDVQVISETQGKVLDVYMNIGDFVSQGKVLVSVEDDLKQSAFLSAKSGFDKAEKDYSRYTNLAKDNFAAESDLEKAHYSYMNAKALFLSAQKELNDTKIKAPISGIITDKNISTGTYISKGTLITNIVDISKLKIIINVSEKYVLKLKKGDRIKISSDLYPGYYFSGYINGISPKGNDSITFPVEIIMNNENQKPLNDGMSIKVEISFGKKEIRSVPRSSLIGSYQNPQIFIVENNTAKLKTIITGSEFDTDIEVISGISDDDQIVVSGQNNLLDNAEVVIEQNNKDK
jgi:RND family efflux transporter MFP subunit